MRWSSNSVKSIRDTEQETLPQHQEAQSSLAFGRFNGVSVIKLMPFECFYNQNKRACTNKLSHIMHSYRVGDLVFGVVGECFKMSPIPLWV
ncbi:hypothetical protein HPCU_00610 [Helicobacter pylori Cuz20]|uniref:Uncharacterized protein n=1 Tax=Helicobacter pylori (strain Cuz20) TaxID=765964 RepID=A0AB32X6K4_HELPC|nr:hypothetical protein [Helicobacter pylori]ADO03308.1 hypothetical protein HPCU_00610 [Helicobacter pylori Cuz20]